MKSRITKNTRAFEVTLANGHVKMPLAETMEEACIIAAAEGILEFGVGNIASVKNDKHEVFGDIKIDVYYNFLAIK